MIVLKLWESLIFRTRVWISRPFWISMQCHPHAPLPTPLALLYIPMQIIIRPLKSLCEELWSNTHQSYTHTHTSPSHTLPHHLHQQHQWFINVANCGYLIRQSWCNSPMHQWHTYAGSGTKTRSLHRRGLCRINYSLGGRVGKRVRAHTSTGESFWRDGR